MTAPSKRWPAKPARILYLTNDASLLEEQLRGRDVALDEARPLLDRVSTDEICPGWACLMTPATLGRYCLIGLRGGTIKPDAVREAGVGVLVAGASKGCGSSREMAPYCELAAGIRVVIAESFEKIYRQNARNIGLLTSTDFSLIPRLAQGEEIGLEEFTKDLDPISEAVVRHGGLSGYNRARLDGNAPVSVPRTSPRPLTIAEKILAAHAVVDAKTGAIGVPAVQPGDAFFAQTDVRFSHDAFTAMAEEIFGAAFGADAAIRDSRSVYAFRDHYTLVDSIALPGERGAMLAKQARELGSTQKRFAERHGVKLFGEVQGQAPGQPAESEAICHNKVIEEIALPGQLVIGTDSHTCMAGALGCLAFGVGSTDMANAWFTKDVAVAVPESVKILLRGQLRRHVCAKDVMLHLLRMSFFKEGGTVGKVLEFEGDGVASMPLDERATLTNMCSEAGGFTGVIAADERVVEFIADRRGLAMDDVRKRIVVADRGADYAATIDVDLGAVEQMVATPGDPHNGIPLPAMAEDVKIDIAYGGSCTGGKKADMDMYAAVLERALARGRTVAPGVRLFIQFGSQDVKKHAEKNGYLDIFHRAGAQVIGPSCGACISAGPGASRSPEQITISAQNRNFPGRSGPGKVYLANPFVVAASAVAGRIVAPED